LSPDDFATVGGALEALSEEYESGSLVPADSDEDVHGALERILIERVGPALGGALRAGRSRNDQIATFVRLYMRDSAQALRSALLESRAGLAPEGIRSGGPRRCRDAPTTNSLNPCSLVTTSWHMRGLWSATFED
jgi:argininosuccinate lyase